ncbi:MAG: tetratricopeptide repeat protein [Chloroflexota bacterium]|nr:tetratricopeptide repeat protein [Chloroflexota bacterium]
MDADWDLTTITEGYRALDLFVDRVALCRRFLGWLNDDPPSVSITYLHGDGGNGKSLILDYLRTRLCHRLQPDNWEYLRSLPEAECVVQAAAAEGTSPIPVARLDLRSGPRDGFQALLKLRRDVTGSGIRFPLFDFAAVTYLHKTHSLTSKRIREIFPAEEIDVVLEIAQVITGFAGLGIVAPFLEVLNRRYGNWFERYRLRRKVDDATVAEIQRMDPETELMQHLGRLFASDLSAGLQDPDGPERVVLFIDNYDALSDFSHDLPEEEFFQRDEWLRRLIVTLPQSVGVGVFLAGREPPRWHEASRLPVTTVVVEHVGNLDEADAITYLELAGVDNRHLQARLCDDARVADRQIHPFSLGLGADLVLAARRAGRDLSASDLDLDASSSGHRRMVVDRLLRFVDAGTRDAVRAVAACRYFDAEIYRYLGATIGFSANLADFRTLIGFSFIRPIANGRFRVHDLLKARIDLAEGTVELQTHAAMERYYRERSAADQETNLAAAIFHANQRDRDRGVLEWLETFQRAFQAHRMTLCAALVDVLPDLTLASTAAHGMLSFFEAQYFHRLSRPVLAAAKTDIALRTLKQAVGEMPAERELRNILGYCYLLNGDLHNQAGDAHGALRNYSLAIASFEVALLVDATNFKFLSGMTWAFLKRAQVHHGLEQITEATDDYIAAEHTIRAALDNLPDHDYTAEEIGLYGNLGIVESHLAEVFANAGDIHRAEQRFRNAIRAFDTALHYHPGNSSFLNSRGSVYHRRGKMHAKREHHHRMARWCYAMAIRDANAALKASRQSLLALENKGTYCEELGWLIATRTTSSPVKGYRDARALFRAGIRAYRHASMLAPDAPYHEAIDRLNDRLSGIPPRYLRARVE